MSDFLFELGVEEVPTSEIDNIADQIMNLLEQRLEDNHIDYEMIENYCTNKRFTYFVNNISDKAIDMEEELKGPPMKVAYDENAQPSIALQKFLQYNKIKESDLIEINTKKGTYLGYRKKTVGKETPLLLKKIIPQILSSIVFNKAMRWNQSDVSFIRPIKNILVLYNNELIECEFADVESSNLIYGHALLSEERIEIYSFKEYIEKLSQNFVILKSEERQQKIESEIQEVEQELDVAVRRDPALMKYHMYNNEYPVVFCGNFDEEYLSLPQEIISTFMIEEKKLFPVFDKNNRLTNIFIGVSNIPDENRNVVSGNEKIIKATFEDAKFFWENDNKEDFLQLRENLKNIMFHKNLGDFYEKTRRLASIVDFLAKETNNSPLSEILISAAENCKNDLATRMVREFPSLQGIMGGLYFKEAYPKKNPGIWRAIYSHYEPRGFMEIREKNLGAALLSFADKIDNIVALLHSGVKVSSSKDPYGLRRDANAIIKIIIDSRLHFDFTRTIDFCINHFRPERAAANELKTQTLDFFRLRLENCFKDFLGFRYDITNAVFSNDTFEIYPNFLQATQVSQMLDTELLEILVTLHRRLKNIIKDAPPYNVSEKQFNQKEEIILFEVYQESKSNIEELIMNNDFLSACSKILEMKPLVDDFFDKVLVMAKETDVRQNRIGLLQKLEAILSKIADFSLIVI